MFQSQTLRFNRILPDHSGAQISPGRTEGKNVLWNFINITTERDVVNPTSRQSVQKLASRAGIAMVRLSDLPRAEGQLRLGMTLEDEFYLMIRNLDANKFASGLTIPNYSGGYYR
jgi:hypothetical protein